MTLGHRAAAGRGALARPARGARAAPRRRRSARRRGQGGAPGVARAARLRRARRRRAAGGGVRAGACASCRRGASRGALLRAAHGRAGYARAAEARQQIRAAPLPARARPRSCARSGARSGARRRGGSPCGRARRARTARCVSMAGLAESVLGVRGEEALGDAVRRCGRRSRAGARWRTWPRTACATSGWRWSSSAWCEATAAGVMFTRAPGARAAAERTSASSTRASGWARRSSTGSPRPTCCASTRAGASSTRSSRTSRARPSSATTGVRGGRRRRAGPAGARRASASPSWPRSPRASRSSSPSAWDVEFACDAERTWVVQARPATGRGFPEGGDADTVWSNVNVGEALPGRRDAVHVVGRRRLQRGRLPPRVRRARVPRAQERAPRRQRPRALLPEPHAVHAHRGAGAVPRPAHARGARRRLGRRRARRRRCRT